MKIQYFPIFETASIDDKRFLLVAKVPIEGSEERIKAGVNFYKDFLNCETVLKQNDQPSVWIFAQEIKLAAFVDIIPTQKTEEIKQLE
jgi:hypothetical protein